MSESELWGLMYEGIQALQTEETTFLTILFGYLIAAHFLAEKLSLVQLFVFNAMYLVTTSGLIFNMSQHWTGLFKWQNAAQIAGAAPVTDGSRQTLVAISIYVALSVASLYFMWLIRSQKS